MRVLKKHIVSRVNYRENRENLRHVSVTKEDFRIIVPKY